MQFTCQTDLLKDALQNVSRAAASRSTILALEGILLKAKNNTLSLTGYDLELGISTEIEANITREGDIILSAKLFCDMVRRLPGETVTIESDEKLLTTINSAAASYTILGLDPSEFPELPIINSNKSFNLPGNTLKSMIDQTLFAVATNDAKPVHKGSLFDISDQSIRIVSVDGFRLALRKEPMDDDVNFHFVVPGKTLSEVSKLIKDEDISVNIGLSPLYVQFTINGYHVISRLLEGDFLDYVAAIPSSHQTEVIVNTRNFIDSVDRISLLISDRLRSPLRVLFTDSVIKASCSTAIGKANDEIPCVKTGDDVEIGFNSKYLLDALHVCTEDEVLLQAGGPLSPMKIVPREGDSFLYLVLPVRLKGES